MSLFQTAYIRETHPLEVTMQPVSKAEVLPQHPNYKPDLFAFKGSRQAPHISEYTLSYGDPEVSTVCKRWACLEALPP